MRRLLLLILLCSTWHSKADNSEFQYRLGDLKVYCPESRDPWHPVGVNCFKKVTSRNLNWIEANALCRLPEHNSSRAFHVENFFVSRELSRAMRFPKQEFWTGWYIEVGADGKLPSMISLSNSLNATSIFNPMWAPLQPLVASAGAGQWCVSLDMNFASEDDYGWRLRDCKKQLPVICETFVCYNDGKNAQYRCRDNSACIPRSALCDHIQDCGDNDDELPPNCDCSCNSGQPKMLTDSYGSIYSPGYATSGQCAPSPGQQCEWQIHQPPGTRLKLNFMSVNLEHGDRLVVEGLDSGEKFSASPGGPTVVVMSGSKLRIRYTPQAGGKPSRGFHLQYTSDDSSTCVRRFESWNGTFSPPTRIPDTSRYRPSTDCMWTIANDEKKLLTVNVPLFELARGDWLIVYDGLPARANVLGNFSRDNPPPRSFVSAEAELNFKFWTQPGTPGDKGFQIMFERTCLNERLEYDFGTIESLGYRNPSRRKPFHCSWIIEPPCAKDAAETCSLTVFFDNLNLTNKDLIVVESGGDFVTFDGSSLPQGAFRTEQSPTIVHMYGRSAQFAASISYSIDCKEPVLTPANTMTLLSDDQPYAYRAEVEFGCLGDFSNGGTRRAACKAGGQWSIAPPMCVMKSCVVPPLQHGDVKKLDRKKQELTWACNFGYRPEKETVSTCTDGGWDPVPQCQEIKCDSDSPDHWPKDITGDSKLSAYRTRVTFGNRVYSRAYYECSKGELRGPQSYLYCQPDGKWSDSYFYCQMLGCLANNVKFGNFSSVWTPLDGQNPIKCINGYEFLTNGAETVPTCKNNFVWSTGSDGNPIACRAKDHCTPNPCGTSGTCRDLNGGYTCSCATGYRFEPTEVAGSQCKRIDACKEGTDLCSDAKCIASDDGYSCQCNSGNMLYAKNLESTKNIPKAQYLLPSRSCIRSRCDVPRLAATTTSLDAPVIVGDSLFLTSTTATAYCPRWPISRVVECTLNAVWNETLDTFTCPQEKCDASMLKLDAATVIVNRIKSDYDLGQTIHFECDTSFPYILVGPSSLICEYDPTDPKHPLKFVGKPPRCILPKCAVIPESLPNGLKTTVIHTPTTPTKEEWVEGTTIRFECPVGWSLRGATNATCIQAPSTDQRIPVVRLAWNVSLPECVSESCVVPFTQDTIPTQGTLLPGQSTTFQCIQPNYVLSDTSPVICTTTTALPGRSTSRFTRSASTTRGRAINDTTSTPWTTVGNGTGYSVSVTISTTAATSTTVRTTTAESYPWSTTFSRTTAATATMIPPSSEDPPGSTGTPSAHGGVSGATTRRKGWNSRLPTANTYQAHSPQHVRNSSIGGASTLSNADFRRRRRARAADPSLHECISEWHGTMSALAGDSAVLYCAVRSHCGDYDVRWIGAEGNETLHTVRQGLVTVSTVEALRPGNEYTCTVSHNSKVVDSVSVAVTVPHGNEGQSWKERIRSTNPSKAFIFDSLKSFSGWNSSVHWHHNADGTWAFQPSSFRRNWLITPFSRVETDWVEVSAELSECTDCYITLGYFSSNHIVTSLSVDKFLPLGGAISAPNSHSIQFALPYSLLWILVTVDAPSPQFVLSRLSLSVMSCPRVKLGLTVYPETIASSHNVSVTGQCSDRSITKSIRPTLVCSPQGTWLSHGEAPPAACFCDKGHVDELGNCIRKGPICYECSSVDKCSSANVRHCDVDESCLSSTRLQGNDMTVQKSCARNCQSSFVNMDRCRMGQEECTLCCDDDYCNWMPSAIGDAPRLSTSPPICLDQQPISVSCPERVDVVQLGPNFTEPILVYWPVIIDNDPHVTIDSSLPGLGSGPYSMTGAEKDIRWTVTDKHGVQQQCITQVHFIDSEPPELTCPETSVDLVHGSVSSAATLRLPSINVRDASSVQLLVEPRNGTQVLIDKPVLVNVTAVDTAGNLAQCQFWHTSVVGDCPLWKIDLNKFQCSQSNNITVCYRKQRCESREIPSNYRALVCVPGHGWRYVQSDIDGGIITHLSAARPMLRAPVCLEAMSSTITLSIEFSVINVPPRCTPDQVSTIKSRLGTYMQQRCDDVDWEYTGNHLFSTSLTMNFTTADRETQRVLTCISRITATLTQSLPSILGRCAPSLRQHSITYHLQCPHGFGSNTNLKCEKCPPGYFVSDESCVECPIGTYANAPGSHKCRPCPSGSSTIEIGATALADCIDQCGPGFYSKTGLAPCLVCPRGTFQAKYNQTTCFSCFFNTTTATVGSKSSTDCKAECRAGMYGLHGVEPCQPCPRGYYQARHGQSYCERCPDGTITNSVGIVSSSECMPNDCTAVGCANRGTCQDGACVCPLGFFGADCSVKINLCSAAYCINGGTCAFDPAGGTRCQCPHEFTGDRCEVSLSCDAANSSGACRQQSPVATDAPNINTTWCNGSINACPNGQCQKVKFGLWECTCNDGFVLNSRSQLCVPEPPCDQDSFDDGSAPCIRRTSTGCFKVEKHGSSNEWSCACSSGYTGRFCETRLDGCSDAVTCENGGTCLPYALYDGSVPYGKCVCAPGYTGTLCSEKVTDPCSTDTCGKNGQCRPYGTDFICECNPGYVGERCEMELNSCATELLNSVTCKNGGTCVNKGPIVNGMANAICECPPGWTGPTCESMVDHCSTEHCLNGGTCIALWNSFYCDCPEGYTGTYCESELSPCTNPPQFDDAVCGHGACHATTLGYNGKFICACKEGWTANGDCTADVDACAVSPCEAGSTCVSLPGGKDYRCICPDDKTGAKCDEKVRFCIDGLCLNHGTCEELPDNYKCHCPIGFTGSNCETATNPCEPNPCQNDGVCVPDPTLGYKCQCAEGYDERNCSHQQNPCDKTPKYCNDGTCVFQSDTGYVYCNCPMSKTGARCETEKDENYNLYFTGVQTPTPQRIISKTIPSSILSSEFTLCGWVKYGADSPSDAGTKHTTADALAPFIVVGIVGKNNKMTQEVIKLSNTGASVGSATLSYSFTLQEWHHVCLMATASGTSFRYYVDGRKVEQVNSNGLKIPQNSESAILLGESPSITGKFIGHVSFVELYHVALSDADIADMAYDCQDWVRRSISYAAIRWTEFTTVDRYNFAILVVHPGICVVSACLPGRPDCSAEHDKNPPEVIQCPTNRYIVTTDRLTQVTWDDTMEHMFRDDGVIVHFASNFRSGQSFGWGQYHVVYLAADEAGNVATCEFNIVISPLSCTDPVTANRLTTVRFTELATPETSKVAHVSCADDTSVFARPVAPFYTCTHMGQWDRFAEPGTSFNFPACTATVDPLQLVNGSVLFVGSCSDSSQYVKQVENAVVEASNKFGGFCEMPHCNGQLILSVSPCTRRRRDTSSGGKVAQEQLDVVYKLNITTTRESVVPVINETMKETFGKNSLYVANRFSCDNGQYPQLHQSDPEFAQCSSCPPGETWQGSSRQCISCPKDTYKTDDGTAPCTSCPSGRITGNITGCIQPADCYLNCEPGTVYDSSDKCVPCPRGQYMPWSGRLLCYSCPAQSTTPSTGSKSVGDCSITCSAGEELSSSEECTKCPVGTYRTVEMPGCQTCEYGFTTLSEGAIAPQQCQVIKCPPGYHRRSDAPNVNQVNGTFVEICDACDIGWFQPDEGKDNCIKCNDGKVTPARGATSEEECTKDPNMSCAPSAPDPCPKNMECVLVDTGGYECRILVHSDPTDHAPPLWVWVISAGSALILALVVFVSFVLYRKKWVILYYRYCPESLMCCKKMTVNDISESDYTRDAMHAPVTQESLTINTTLGRSTLGNDVKESNGTTNRATVIGKFDSPGRRSGTRSVERTRSNSPPESVSSAPEDPLNEIRTGLMEFLSPDDVDASTSRHAPPPTPPPIPQSKLTVQTSMRQNSKKCKFDAHRREHSAVNGADAFTERRLRSSFSADSHAEGRHYSSAFVYAPAVYRNPSSIRSRADVLRSEEMQARMPQSAPTFRKVKAPSSRSHYLAPSTPNQGSGRSLSEQRSQASYDDDDDAFFS